MRAVGLIRVSTERQSESGLGLEAQRSSILAAAERLGAVLGRIFVEAGVSGGLPIADRPVMMEAIGALKRGDLLIFAKRDRIARDTFEAAMVERLVAKRGSRIVSAAGEGTDSDDPAAILMRRMIDSFAEYEKLIIRSRTRVALAAKRQRGERTSRFAPFGFQLTSDGRRLDPDANEQGTVRLIRALHAEGRSLRSIAAHLNDTGIKTRCGGTWKHVYVFRALRAAGASAREEASSCVA